MTEVAAATAATTTTSSSSPDDQLTLLLTHNKKEYTINVPLDQTVKFLRAEVDKQTTVPPSLQKYIFKGSKVPKDVNTKIKKETELIRNLNLKSGTKVMLIGSTIDQVISVTAPGLDGGASSKKKQEEDLKSPVPTRMSEMKEHAKNIEKGVPAGAEPGDKENNLPLPKTIKGIYDRSGQLVRLTFKTEEQELWIASKERTEKIPFSQIRDVDSEPIHKNENYHIMSLQIGTAPNSKLWFYYVPAQYHKAIKYAILGMGSFPFLKQ